MGSIRFLLALSVLLYHSEAVTHLPLLGGLLPVRSFFIISGFYMALILREKYIVANGSYWLFIKNRLLRIYPAYLFILFFTVFVSFFIFQNGTFHSFELFSFQSFKTILLNGFVISANNFSLSPFIQGTLLVSQAWTLAIEMLFYFCAPFLAKRSTLVLIIIGGLSGIIRYSVFHWQTTHGIIPQDFFFPGEVFYFILGIFSYRFFTLLRKEAKFRLLSVLVFLSFLLYTICFPSLLVQYQYKWFVLRDCLYLLLLTVTIPYAFVLTSRSRIDRLLGELSYPLYLCHVLVYVLLVRVLGKLENPHIFLFIYIAVSLAFAFTIYLAIEKPIDTIRQKALRSS